MKGIDESHHKEPEEFEKLVQGFNEKLDRREDIESIFGRLDKQYCEINNQTWEIRSNEKLVDVLNKHWKIVMTQNFNKRYAHAGVYCYLLEALDNQMVQPTPEAYREFAGNHNVHRSTVYRWAKGMKKPNLINQLESLEKADLYETSFSESTRVSRLDGKRRSHLDLIRLVEDATSQLELGPMISAIPHLSELSKQLTGLDSKYISGDTRRISGVSLHLLCDIIGLSIDQFEGGIAKITGANGHGGIRNPKFPVSDNFEILKARIIGIAVSDCHIPKTGSLHLTEGSLDRINRVKKILDNFGTTYDKGSVCKRTGDYEFYIASPLAHALNYWGIPSGDRTVLNYGLPGESRLWSLIAKCSYMQEMLAQEGNVDKNGVINWSRSHALFDGQKGPLLGFKSRISQEAIEFLLYSKYMRKYQGIVSEQAISIGRLESLKDYSDNHVSTVANELISVVSNYRNRLINDEKALTTSLGIRIRLKPVRISYFEKSNRVSIRWQARVYGYESKIRSALIIPPNFDTKERALLNWLLNQSADDVQQTKMQLKSEGFRIQA